ncbi:hypothetical protein ACA910_000745 [Epithemia clementina (nom. ined.)]
MNQFMRWVENSNGAENESRLGSSSSSSSRPSLIRTKCSFDGNDETFSLVALNMLSRYTYFGLSPADAICDTLVTPRERSCFLEALSVRKMYSNQQHHHLSPSTVSLIQTVDDNFGKDLVRIVEMEGGPSVMTFTTYGTGIGADLSTATSQQQQQRQGMCHRQPTSRRCSEDRRSSCRSKKGGTSSGKRVRAFFFPEHHHSAAGGMFGATTKGGGKGTTTVRNIDWKLAEAIEQVNNLTLDGMHASPTATEASTISSSSLAYEPPTAPTARPVHFHEEYSNKMF